MSDNLDFMAIFGREGSLDLGSGGEDFDTLFAEKEALQPPEEKAPEATTGAVQQEMTPVEVPNPEEKKEDANAEACGSQGIRQAGSFAYKPL